MPHVNGSGGEDLASTDEVKVYNDEGEQEEQRSEKFLSEVKLGLVTETEQGKTNGENGFNEKDEDKNGTSSRGGALESELNNPFLFYGYHNGATSGKVPGFGMYNEMLQPPPAHSGIQPGLPLLSLDKSGLHRPSLFPLPGASGQYPLYSDWPGTGYSSVGMRSAYSGLLAARGYPHSLMSSPLSPGMSQPTLVHPGQHKQEIHPSMLQENRFMSHPFNGHGDGSHHEDNQKKEKKTPHIKKPLNAFMLFMKEMRAQVVAECTLKESAAINQILGRKWHALDRAEQAKYYDMAKKERELHLKLYPGWSARDNYAMHSKKKKRRRESQTENKECSNPKKCRARFGLDQQSQWCKPCRRKKKCIRFMTGDPDADERSDDEDSHNNNGGDSDDVSSSQGDLSEDIHVTDEISSSAPASTTASSSNHSITNRANNTVTSTTQAAIAAM